TCCAVYAIVTSMSPTLRTLIHHFAATGEEHPRTMRGGAWNHAFPAMPLAGTSAGRTAGGLRAAQGSQGLKPIQILTLVARLKPCPDTKPTCVGGRAGAGLIWGWRRCGYGRRGRGGRRRDRRGGCCASLLRR